MLCINEGFFHNRLLLVDFVNKVIKLFFSFLQNVDVRTTDPYIMFYKVIVYQIVDFYLIATSADPVLSFLCGDKSTAYKVQRWTRLQSSAGALNLILIL